MLQKEAVLEVLSDQQTAAPPGFARKGRSLLGAGWHTLAPQDLPRQPNVDDDPIVGLYSGSPDLATNAEDILATVALVSVRRLCELSKQWVVRFN
jgi:hypothetical protein